MSTKYIASNWRLPNQAGVDSYLNDNYGLTFSGSSEKINCGDSDVLSFGDGSNDSPFSISLWFNLSTLTTPSCLLCKQTSSSNGEYKIYISTAGKIYIELANNGGEANGARGIISNSTISINQWYNIIFTYDGTGGSSAYDGMNLYINNSLDSSTDFSYLSYTAMNNTTADFVIGDLITGSSNTYDFTGKMSELAVFDYALSSTQISTLYGSSSLGAGNPMALKPAPVAFYPLGDNSSGNPLTQPNEAVEDASVFKFDDAPSNNFIDLGLINAIENSTSFTLSFWINPSSFTTPFTLLGNKTGFSGDSAKGIAFDVRSTFLIVYLSDGFTDYARVNNPLSQNEWTLLSVVYDGSGSTNADRLKIYYGSTQQTVNTFGGTIPSTSPTTGRSLILGKQATGQCIEASISNLTIFSNALPTTGTESIETLYNNGVPLNSITSENLRAWYKLDQSANWDVSGSGYWDIPDASGNGNDGTSSGMTSANLVLSDLTRNLPFDSYSFNFDANASDYIDCGTGLGNSLTTVTNLTVSTWIKADITNGNDLFFNIGSFSNSWGKIAFQLNGDNLLIRINDNAYFIQKSYSSDDWNNISFVYDGSDVNKTLLYINGQEQTPDSSGGVYPSSIDLSGLKTIIGAGYNTPYTFDGKMSNVSIFNQTLTSTQVMKLYSNGMPQDLSTFTPAPVAWWTLGSNSFFNGSDFICKDLIGSNDGTSFNAGVDALKGNTPRSEANGTGSNMDIPTNLKGQTKYSSNNSWSINMSESARVADTP